MTEFLTALGLAIVIEGVCYALFPDGMRKMMAQVMELPSSTLRMVGLGAALFGLAVIWVLRS